MRDFIKINMHEQRCVMKFFFLQENGYKAIYGVVGEATVGLATVECCCQRFKLGSFSDNGYLYK
jgi:hypothetical protein